jgi:hypothetical protein
MPLLCLSDARMMPGLSPLLRARVSICLTRRRPRSCLLGIPDPADHVRGGADPVGAGQVLQPPCRVVITSPLGERPDAGHVAGVMYVVGSIDVIAGLIVLISPKWGSLLVAAWLGGIIVNLLTIDPPRYHDIAARDLAAYPEPARDRVRGNHRRGGIAPPQGSRLIAHRPAMPVTR